MAVAVPGGAVQGRRRRCRGVMGRCGFGCGGGTRSAGSSQGAGVGLLTYRVPMGHAVPCGCDVGAAAGRQPFGCRPRAQSRATRTHALARPLLRMVMHRCEGSVVHAETAAAVMRARTRLERIAVAPHPPNLAIGAEPMPERPPLRLLFLGFVGPKGSRSGDRCGCGVRRRGVDLRLTIAGDFWEDPAAMREDLATRMLADVVELRVGYVPDEEIGPSSPSTTSWSPRIGVRRCRVSPRWRSPPADRWS